MQTTARNGECYSSLVDSASTRAKGELVGERDSRKKAMPAAATAAKIMSAAAVTKVATLPLTST